MHKRLVEILEAALGCFWSHAQLVGLANTDESAFGSFVLAEFRRQVPRSKCQTDNHRTAPLVQVDGLNVLIEFKFYIQKQTGLLNDTASPRKADMGSRSDGEPCNSVDKLTWLTLCPYDRIHEKYVVLAYQRDAVWVGRPSFGGRYEGVRPVGSILNVTEIPHPQQNRLVCLLLRVQ